MSSTAIGEQQHKYIWLGRTDHVQPVVDALGHDRVASEQGRDLLGAVDLAGEQLLQETHRGALSRVPDVRR